MHDAETAYADARENHMAGRLDEAERLYREVLAIIPHHADSRHLIGVIAYQTGQHETAIRMIGEAIAIDPNVASYRYNLGIALYGKGLVDEAIISLRCALSLKADYSVADFNLGYILQQRGMLDDAIVCYRRVIGLTPNDPNAHYNLGIILQQLGMLDEAIVCFRRAVDLKPDHAELYNSLGGALEEQSLSDEAIVCFRRAITLKPNYPEAHNNLGVALKRQGHLYESSTLYRTAIGLRPDYAGAHYNLGMALLAQGDMAVGWQEYEWRWKVPEEIRDQLKFAEPQWQGEPAVGKVLLIHCEQGFGDTIQFCRYAPLATAMGLKVIIVVRKPLVRLLGSLRGVEMVVERGAELPNFDLYCPMLSMPLALGTTIATIPGASRYLHANETQLAFWRMRLAATGNKGRRVGLAWAGSTMSGADRRRSMTPDRLARLFGVAGLDFFSLQIGGPAMPKELRVTDVMDEMDDFADTAALIANLDLIISVDTAIGHLGAALGKPVWLLDRFDPCWRWLVGRRDSPWYPTLRIYRQPRPGDWESVLAEVTRDLRSFAHSGESDPALGAVV